MKTISKSKSEVLKSLCRYLSENTDYCIVGDTDSLPEEILSDVDFVVDLLSIEKITEIIFCFTQKKQINLIQVLQHEHTAFCFIFAWMTEKGKWTFLHPDICSDYYSDGRKFISAKKS